MKKKETGYIDRIVQEIREKTGDEKLTAMFEICYRNTLDTTVKDLEDGTTFVITGDIDAMWLRDSAAQLRPYLFWAKEDADMLAMITGLVKRQFQYIKLDSYANAFNKTGNGACWAQDETLQNPWVWERKYEVDSLCYPVQLAWLLWKNTGCTAQFEDNFVLGVQKILEVFETEQCHEERSAYRFQRRDTYFQDTLSREGKGALVKSGTGMTWSGFRPSDDACVYGYLIPSNMFAVVILGYLEEIAECILKNEELKKRAAKLRLQIQEGIETYGITKKEGFGSIYAYETDGFGQFNLMDDANVPSLLSMEYLGYQGKSQTVAENTRSFILSAANPYYYEGIAAKGIGSLHTPAGYIWPIALAMEGLTGAPERKREILKVLCETEGGTDKMHESFLANNPKQYTRPWFSWANALFCELVLDYCGYHLKK